MAVTHFVSYEILSPFEQIMLSFTDFGCDFRNIAQLSNQAISVNKLPNRQQLAFLAQKPITIFNAKIQTFKGKKNLTSQSSSIVKINYLPNVEAKTEILSMLKKGEIVSPLDMRLTGFNSYKSIKQLLNDPSESVEAILEEVCIFKMMRIKKSAACRICFKN